MQLKKAAPPVADINVTPMVDVMLVVLIIFMVITPLLNKGANVELAIARNPTVMADASKEDAIVVAITKDGQLYLSPGLEKVDDKQLTEKVKDMIGDKPAHIVYMRADGRAKYSAVEDAVDDLRAAKIEDVGLLTEQQMNNTMVIGK